MCARVHVCVSVSDQCRRRACRKADSPSMMSRMATVRVAKSEKMIDRPKNPPPLREERPRCITMDQSTSDNSAESMKNSRVHTKNIFEFSVTERFLIDASSIMFLNSYNRTSWGVFAYVCIDALTHVHERGWEPRGASRKPCWRCIPNSTRWCEWPGEQLHHQSQTASGETRYLEHPVWFYLHIYLLIFNVNGIGPFEIYLDRKKECVNYRNLSLNSFNKDASMHTIHAITMREGWPNIKNTTKQNKKIETNWLQRELTASSTANV